jgi:MFS family permease
MKASRLLLCATTLYFACIGSAWSKSVTPPFCVKTRISAHTRKSFRTSRSLSDAVATTRAGSFEFSVLNAVQRSPATLYDVALTALTSGSLLWKLFENGKVAFTSVDQKPPTVLSLQTRFLAVFWLMRMADWLQGPYFFEVYSSKVYDGIPVTTTLVSQIFLTGFAVTGALGPIIGRLVDRCGRKKGTIAFALLYTVSAFSTFSNKLWVVLLGRVAGGLGTSLLFSAPEAWLVGEHARSGSEARWLGETFGWAYAGDSIVAILAGQLAGQAARRAGPTGPFALSVIFLVTGAAVALATWRENTAGPANADSITQPASAQPESSVLPLVTDEIHTVHPIRRALQVALNDKRILFIGSIQALFEGAMYIFVLQWPPLMKAAIHASSYGAQAVVPYGQIFSCLMASCLLGSTAFGALQKRGVPAEKSAPAMLATAALAMTAVTRLQALRSPSAIGGLNRLLGLSGTLFLFEACVGMYFPTIGTLRSKYLPDQYRSVLMNLFGLPLNMIVISVVLSARWLGAQRSLAIATAALAVATVCGVGLAMTANATEGTALL